MNGTSTNHLPPLPDRPEDAHKGTFGTVVVVGGSANMIGAPSLTAGAALRTGCGLARIATLPAVLPFCLTIEPSATGLFLPDGDDPDAMDSFLNEITETDVVAIGPGMGRGDRQQDLISTLLRQENRTVIDADGLNNLANMDPEEWANHGPLVLTPHPGEFHRLAEPHGIDLSPTDPNQRPEAAAALAEAYGAVVVLKGFRTVISDGQRHAINTTGTPAMATAGTGDVLTGVIASLIAQGMEPFDAAVLGAYLHGLAGNLWSDRFGRSGLTAKALVDLIPEAAEQHRHPR